MGCFQIADMEAFDFGKNGFQVKFTGGIGLWLLFLIVLIALSEDAVATGGVGECLVVSLVVGVQILADPPHIVGGEGVLGDVVVVFVQFGLDVQVFFSAGFLVAVDPGQ